MRTSLHCWRHESLKEGPLVVRLCRHLRCTYRAKKIHHQKGASTMRVMKYCTPPRKGNSKAKSGKDQLFKTNGSLSLVLHLLGFEKGSKILSSKKGGGFLGKRVHVYKTINCIKKQFVSFCPGKNDFSPKEKRSGKGPPYGSYSDFSLIIGMSGAKSETL